MDVVTRLLLDASFSLKAKDAVMTMALPQQRCHNATTTVAPAEQRSLHPTITAVCDKQQHPTIPELEESDDGDSSSTLLLEDLEESSVIDDDASSSGSVMDLNELLDELMHLDDTPVVHFATPLITKVHTRPRTEHKEKRALYYSESEYRRFRREFAQETAAEEEDIGVVFHENVVTDVWEFEPPQDSSVLYYSEAELQSFLDEFVESLGSSHGDESEVELFL